MLRKKKFLALVLSSVLLVTGCSSSATSQEQAVKLVEYEKCLEMQQSILNEQNRIGRGALFILTDPDTQTGRIRFFDEFILEKCSAYRP
jgi:hypothetical protein